MNSKVAAPAPALVPDGEQPIGAGELHVWRYDLDSHRTGEPAPETLSQLELGHAARFVFERDRRRFRAGRRALRYVLGRYLLRPAGRVPLAVRPDGKPHVVGCDLEFNVSHSQNEWVCAVSRDAPVGVDIEVLRAVPDCLSLADTHFTPTETSALGAVPKEYRELAFLTCWTRKEAYLKLLGIGIPAGLDGFVAGLGPDDLAVASIAPETPGEVLLRTFSPGHGIIGAVACMGAPYRVDNFEIPASWMATGETRQ
jgi:4'-phosphopantetheinyl transferase